MLCLAPQLWRNHTDAPASNSVVRLFETPWTVAHQTPLSMGFSRQEHWSGLPFPSPGDLPNPGIKPRSLALQADSLLSEPPGKLYHLNTKICPFPGLLLLPHTVVPLPNPGHCHFPIHWPNPIHQRGATFAACSCPRLYHASLPQG